MPQTRKRNTYELRSREVQEVLSKPPSHLILWSNLIIVFVFVIALILFSHIKIPAKKTGNQTLLEYLLKK
ncbi:hypothetical protein [Chitinophaga sp. LS1]|uniref:hypothetical protein n=1 Tax=Chitinophaga sp. LS1 TaxID=3051176 RepID=UPI002AABDA64|nr:hypothetical protein [Chitinophaga sp. LS1]WPV65517.1 hypothetical protein QQL36_27320 [Chitinophaga sp. LS1]